ncbi:T9SS type A sorting domain-containing protein [Psychroserpens mesophilus]|uniref:T9SS type A sorting domain-containing protein n=1 Tax=Psychroserpens mesophilus TaxID=325473 RepID=UPI003D64B441
MFSNKLQNFKIIFVLIFLLSFGTFHAQNGILDPTFGTNGIVNTTNNEDPEQFNTILEVNNNKFLAAGTADYNATIIRFNQDGSIDTSFGVDGILELDFGGTREDIEDMVKQPDGKILITAETKNSNDDYDFIVARLNEDGSYDTSFGTNGISVITFGSSTDERPNKIIVTPDDKIIIVGNAEGGIIWKTAIARLNSDGSLDTTFSDDGLLTLSITNRSDYLIGVDVTFDGKIIAAGGAVFNSGSNQGRYAIVRYLNNGDLDPTFGTNGVVTLNIFDGSCIARSIISLPDGKSLVAGHASGSNVQMSFAVIRLDIDGNIDTTFGDNGVVSTPFSTNQSQIYKMKLDDNNNIYVVGDASNNTNNEATNFAAAKYSFNGDLDTTFGTNGTVSTDFFGTHDSARDFIITQNKITLAGYTMETYPDENFALARYDLENNLSISNVSLSTFEVFPTLVNNSVSIKSKISSNSAQISIMNIQGKLVFQQTTIINSIPKSIDLKSLTKGLYFLKIQIENQLETYKIIKQ